MTGTDFMTGLGTKAWDDRPLLGAVVLLAASLGLGGGGSSHRLAELLIEMTAIPVAAVTFAMPLRAKPERLWTAPVILLCLWAALIIGQQIPLSAPLWRALPGRELAGTIADQIGAGNSAHALSFDPAATARALAALLPAAVMLLLVVHMEQRQRSILALAAVGCAFASLLLGLVQLITAGRWGVLYPEGHLGYATGFFANRNHQASFLLLAASLSCSFVGKRNAASLPLLLVVATLLAGALATRSRAALLLFPLTLLPLFPMRASLGWKVVLPAIFAIAAGLWILVETNQVAQITVDRLWNGNLGRLTFWKDSWSAIALYWPAGTGFGTFADVFRVHEPLEHVGRHYVNHAHNELLEVALEGGLPALLLLTGGIAWWIGKVSVFRHASRQVPRLGIAAWTGLLVLMLHSLVDYPLRMLPIEVMGAMLAGFLLPPASRAARGGISGQLQSESDRPEAERQQRHTARGDARTQ